MTDQQPLHEPSDDPDALFMQALGFLQTGIYGPARSLLDRAIRLNEEQERPVAAAYARMALARLHSDEKRLDEARTELETAAAALEAAGDGAGQLRATFELGELAERQGQPDEARAAYERALAYASDAGDRAAAQMRIAVILKERGEQQEAAAYYRQARENFAQAGNDLGAGRASYELATLTNVVDETEAHTLLDEAESVAREWNVDELLELVARARRAR